MDKEQLINDIEAICNEFPNVIAELSAVLQEFRNKYRRNLAAQADNYYIRAILGKEFLKKVRHSMLEDYAKTLKELAKPSAGRNSGMPHLKSMHSMTRSYHFRVLCNAGLAVQHHRGAYRITENGWKVLERAYKISLMKPIEDADFKAYIDIIK